MANNESKFVGSPVDYGLNGFDIITPAQSGGHGSGYYHILTIEETVITTGKALNGDDLDGQTIPARMSFPARIITTDVPLKISSGRIYAYRVGK